MALWLRRTAIAAGVLIGLWLLAWLAVPPLFKWQAEPRLSALLGRNVSMGEVAFRPWSVALSVHDLVIGPAPSAAPGTPPLLQVERLRADLSFWALFRGMPVVQAIEIDAPRLQVARVADGRYDVDDLLERFGKPSAAPASRPVEFALHALALRGGQVRFDDRPVGRVHSVEALTLSLPFLSNRPSQVEVAAEPHLSFKLNGTPFDSGAQATPFAPDRHALLKLAVRDLDVQPYLGYLPAALPVRPARGSLSTDLSLEFQQAPDGTPSLALRGTLNARDLALTHADGAPLASWRELRLGLRDVRPLARRLVFDTLRIEGAQLQLARDATGRLTLLPEAEPEPEPGPPLRPAARRVARPASAAASAATAEPARPWQVQVESVELANARVLWNDASTQPAAALQFDGVTLAVKRLQWPMQQPAAVSLSATVRPLAPASPAAKGEPAAAGRLSAEGTASDQAAQLDLAVSDLALHALAPYIAQAVVPRLDGRVSARGRFDWSADPKAPQLRLTLPQATLDALRVQPATGRSAAPDAASLRQLALAEVQLDIAARSVVLGSVKLTQPSLQVVRNASGQVNVAGWWRSEPAATPRPGTAAAPSASGPTRRSDTPAADPPWRVEVRSLALEGGRFQWADSFLQGRAREEPLRAELSQVHLGVQGFVWQGERPVPSAKLQLSARLGSPATAGEPSRPVGSAEWKGELGLQPLRLSGGMRVTRLPAHLLAAYAADALPVSLLRAEAGYTGQLALQELPGGLSVSAAGDVLLGDVHVTTLTDASGPATLVTGADELLSWQALSLKRVKFGMKPGERPQLDVGEVELNDFYSRLVVTEEGHFNLQDVARARGAEPQDAANAGEPVMAAASATVAATASAPASSVAGASASASASDALPLDISVGAIRVSNGHVDFSDHFVRPNYSAALTELEGELSAFSSTSRQMATLRLRGRAAGTALLDIGGQINPSVKPLALDIKARASDLELAPLSPYAGKYAGYAIERGKLSLDVAYKVDEQGQLTASNQLVLNQLTFGERIESPTATKLPVLLAVAILKDRNGVIDLNLPISGSVNDPQFSVGGIIVKLLLNVLGKALTAPFSLLAGGGGQDLSAVEFRPGTAQVSGSGEAAIDKVARALTERPALHMTVTGMADLAAEREAYQREVIDTRLLSERRREGLRAGAAASAPVSLSGQDRSRLLKALYRQSDLPDKPRNALGIARDLPDAEMEQLLRRHVAVTDEALRQLALQRGTAVRDALIAKGLSSERIFLAAPRLHEPGAGEGAWTPRVQLSLSTR